MFKIIRKTILVLLCTFAFSSQCSAAFFSAKVSGPATSQTILANITPDTADSGKTGNYYLAAMIGNDIYFSDGSNWLRYAGGRFPIFRQGSLASQSLVVVQSANVTSLGGISIFAGYGTNESDLTDNHKYGLIYTIPPRGTTALVVSPASANITISTGGGSASAVTSFNVIAISNTGDAVTIPAGDLTFSSSNPQVALVTPAMDANNSTTGGAIFPQIGGTTTLSVTSKSLGLTSAMQLSVARPAPTYEGPQGIFNVPTTDFHSIITMLDTGDIYGIDLIGTTVAGFYHGALSGTATQVSSSTLTEYNVYDGGYLQPASISAQYAQPALAVTLTFPFGTYKSQTGGQMPYSAGDTRAMYSNPIPLSSLAGNYAGTFSSVGAGIYDYIPVAGATISSDGTFSATVAGCTFNGAMAQHGATGVYDFAATVIGASCGLSGQMIGIVTPITYYQGIPTLGLQMTSLNGQMSGMFRIQRGS